MRIRRCRLKAPSDDRDHVGAARLRRPRSREAFPTGESRPGIRFDRRHRSVFLFGNEVMTIEFSNEPWNAKFPGFCLSEGDHAFPRVRTFSKNSTRRRHVRTCYERRPVFQHRTSGDIGLTISDEDRRYRPARSSTVIGIEHAARAREAPCADDDQSAPAIWQFPRRGINYNVIQRARESMIGINGFPGSPGCG